MRRAILTLALLVPLAGCSGSAPARAPSANPEILAQVADLASFVRETWHLPFRVQVFLPQPESPEDERLARAQLGEVKQAYAHASFDLFAADVAVAADGERELRLDPDSLRLELCVPSGGEVFSAKEILACLGDDYRWKRSGRWYQGEKREDLVAALRRDLVKLSELEEVVARGCRRLELIAGILADRAAQGGDAALCPTEADYAREAQFRATFALNRVLNTLARWRLASADESLSVNREALTALHYARMIHEVYLDWLLRIVVGGRTKLKLWADDWWHRNALYKALDSAAPMIPIDGKRVPGTIPEGSMRALLSLRLDDDLRDLYEDLDARWENRAPTPRETPLLDELRQATDRMQAIRVLGEEKPFDGFTAWKELWDARLKGAVSLPFYGLISAVAQFLGDTRTTHPPPAVSDEQLQALAADLRPGDVILVRQDRYLSNAFLPGFWPHALLYLGPPEAWSQLELEEGKPLAEDPIVGSVLSRYRKPIDGHPARVIEAISEGVVFNSLEHAVQKDYVAVLRPVVPQASLAQAIRRALRFLDRPYDFSFDFATDDRIVCTELVYRAYDPDMQFAEKHKTQSPIPGVVDVMGRMAMPANELARLLLYMHDHPQPDKAIGYPGKRMELVALYDREVKEGPAERLTGADALARLRETVDR